MSSLLRYLVLGSTLLLAGAGIPAAPQSAPAKSPNSPAASGPASAQGSADNAALPSPSSNANQEVVHASNESAGRTPQESDVKGTSAKNEEEDEEAAFKYSPAVQGLARITRLSLNAAYWVCVVINFAIIAILILLAMRSNLPAMLRGRTQEIQKGIDEARRSSEDATRRLQEIEARLSRLNQDIEEMQQRAAAESRAEEERILASIDEEKNKILQAAEQEVSQATSAARRELQKYAVSLAVDMAEKGLRVDTGEDKALVDELSRQLSAEARRNGGS